MSEFTRAHTHTRTHIHKHTHTDLNFAIFEKITKSNTRTIETMLIREFKYTQNSSFFNESIRSNKDSWQIGRTKLKYLHVWTKWLKNARWGSSFLVKFHASSLNYLKGFAYILNWCIRALVYSELLSQILGRNHEKSR